MRRVRLITPVLLIVTALASPVEADPCGMVLPIPIADGTRPDIKLERSGLQQTYVFFHSGLETVVIQPGFTGNLSEFGMLVPMPSVPAIRKVPDDVFQHIEQAIDPPILKVNLNPRPQFGRGFGGGLGGGFGGAGGLGGGGFGGDDLDLGRNQTVVLKEETVGMYEAVVLASGSAEALKSWMDDHDYRFPDGMEATCEEYIEQEWCFVAVRAKLAAKESVDPQPGMRTTAPGLGGGNFTKRLQAMGFRFATPRLVVPMRLSVFNTDDTRNLIYLLTAGPMKMRFQPTMLVKRQVPGTQLYKHLTDPIPIKILGLKGNEARLPAKLQAVASLRDPAQYNGIARDLFSSDLHCLTTQELMHESEVSQKNLFLVSDRLGLDARDIGDAVDDAVSVMTREETSESLDMLKQMTLTVLDGSIPAQLLASRDLTFHRYLMPARRNTPNHYHAPSHRKPSPEEPFLNEFGGAGAGFFSVSQANADLESASEEQTPSERSQWPVLFSVVCLLALMQWRVGVRG